MTPLVRWSAIALVLALGAAAWITGATHRFFDYDEICNAHVTWLIAQGQIPFHDFQASHSPFLWYPLAWLWRILPDVPSTLVPLRLVGGVGTAISIVAMMAAAAVVRPELTVAWMTIGVAAVGFQISILEYALEFRPDSWSTALLFFGFWLYLRRAFKSTWLRCAMFGGVSSLAVLLSPKFVALPLIFVPLELIDRIHRRDEPVLALFGYAVGISLTMLLAFAALGAARIDPKLAFDMAIAYQWDFVMHGGFGRGLLTSVIQQQGLLILVLAGVLAWCAHLFAQRQRPHAYEMAVLLFLVTQFAIVDRPYKQYYAPWFLLAASFVPFVGVYAERHFNRVAPWCFLSATLLSVWAAGSALHTFFRHNQAQQLVEFYDDILRLTTAEDSIIAYPPLHPVVRRDVFYAWSRTTSPTGYSTEAVMRSLALPDYSARFDRRYYHRQLEANPPALVVSPRNSDWGYDLEQSAAIDGYLRAHHESYAVVDRGLLQPVWVRRDRHERVLQLLNGAGR